jgi:hypothetical protein
MSKEDADVGVVTNDRWTYFWTSSQPGSISNERLDEYRRLFRGIGVIRLEKDGAGNVYLEVHTEGFVTHGADKGLLYCVGPRGHDAEHGSYRYPPCTEQHEQGRQGQKGDGYEGYAYLRLAQNWYVIEKWD